MTIILQKVETIFLYYEYFSKTKKYRLKPYIMKSSIFVLAENKIVVEIKCNWDLPWKNHALKSFFKTSNCNLPFFFLNQGNAIGSYDPDLLCLPIQSPSLPDQSHSSYIKLALAKIAFQLERRKSGSINTQKWY